MIRSIQKKSMKNSARHTKKDETAKKSSKTTMENTLTKLNNLSNVVGNNSILTQRNNSLNKQKIRQINPESKKTARMQSSQKKIVNTKSIRQCQYEKQKAKELNKFINKKISIKKEDKQEKRSRSAFNSIEKKQNVIKICEQPFKRVQIPDHLTKLSKFLNQGTEKITQIKKNSDSFLLEQMGKVQKMLLQKISCIESNNANFKIENNQKFNEILQNNNKQVDKCRNQIKYLVLKIEQQTNKNLTLQKKIIFYEKDLQELRAKIELKDSFIIGLQKENNNLSSDNNRLNSLLRQFQMKITNIENDYSVLKDLNAHLEQKLKKRQAEKHFIRQNSVRVLELLREEFGDDLKHFTTKQTSQLEVLLY